MIYILIYPIFYVGRAFFIKKRITLHEIINIFVHSVLIFTFYKLFSFRAIIYLSLSSWLGYSIHPCAAHLIQEHFTFRDGQETYSYYGSLNAIFMNIGYHNEHHDFAAVPWESLPKIRETAPEYYNRLMYFTSWLFVFYVFIFEDIGPKNRVFRTLDDKLKDMEV
ncbi:Sphingolipid delta(4)-desaturase DES1 [Dictyocoela muelleri]|nr:Sphingolipid delta(4)-desaturase DES1 [Dictyocoela muelleri]